MSYDPLDIRKDYAEYAEFNYYSRTSGGDTTSIQRRLEEPGFDKLVEAFMEWAAAIYQWDRKDMKAKAFEAVAEWEV